MGTVEVGVSGGKFSCTFKPTYRGSWRFVAKYSGGSVSTVSYLSSKSTTKTVKVKWGSHVILMGRRRFASRHANLCSW